MTYVEGIRWAYTGEIAGERLYKLLSVASGDLQQRQKFLAISDVERCTNRVLAPIAARLQIGLAEAELNASIQHRFKELSSLSWLEFIRKATLDWPSYVVKFERLEHLAPPSDKRALQILVDHERALVQFVHLEAGHSTESLHPLRSFLAAAVLCEMLPADLALIAQAAWF